MRQSAGFPGLYVLPLSRYTIGCKLGCKVPRNGFSMSEKAEVQAQSVLRAQDGDAYGWTLGILFILACVGEEDVVAHVFHRHRAECGPNLPV